MSSLQCLRSHLVVILITTWLICADISLGYDVLPIMTNGLEMLRSKTFLDLCTVGPKLKFVALKRYNTSSGAQIVLQDPQNSKYYEVKIGYFDRNWFPAYVSQKLTPSVKTTGQADLTVLRRIKLSGPNTMSPLRIAIREHVMFERAMQDNPKLIKYRMIAFSNEIIGCPPVLCYNPNIDAADYQVNKKKFVYFRGFYYWETMSKDTAPNPNEARLIMHDFPGAPPTVDAVTSFVHFMGNAKISGETAATILFVRENFVFIRVQDTGIMQEYNIADVFEAGVDFSHQNYIDDIIRISDTRVHLAMGTTHCVFDLERPMYWKNPYKFSYRQCLLLNTNNILTNINAAMTVSNANPDQSITIFFQNWDLFEVLTKDYTKGLLETGETIQKALEKGKAFPHLAWSCEQSMYRGFVSSRKMYEDTYIKTLSKLHDTSNWSMIKGGAKSYDMQMIYILMAVVTTFLAVSYGALCFICTFYCLMSSSIEQRLNKQKSKSNLAPDQVTEEAILTGKVTASQLLNAGMITPSAIQNLQSKASRLGPDYSSSIGSHMDEGGARNTASKVVSKVQEEVKSKISSKITPSTIKSTIKSSPLKATGSKVVGSHTSHAQ